jgi:hydroxylysine kinase
VHGIPGFGNGEDAEGLDFEHLGEDDAIAIASERFAIEASSAERLNTERDDSFRLASGRRSVAVLKVAHPADSWTAIDLQLRALKHARRADPSLPLQRIVPPTGGGLAMSLPDGRIARVFEWIPGDLLLEHTTNTRELDALGDALGRLSRALSTFPDTDAHHLSAWDLGAVPRLATLLAALPNDAVAAAVDGFTTRVGPRLDELPRQVIHNDFNPGNVLVDPIDPGYVTGILDFGDVIYSLRVADLAVALSYQLSPLRHKWLDLAPMISAFERYVPLTDTEREVLPDLVAARFAQRILVNGWLERNGQDRAGQHDANVRALTALLNLEG